jgi:hypothetical protein
MQKWEYCELELSIGGPIARVTAVLLMYQADGKHKEFSNQYGVLLAMLGDEGWEMVGSTWHAAAPTLTTGQKINYVFKRPKQETTL